MLAYVADNIYSALVEHSHRSLVASWPLPSVGKGNVLGHYPFFGRQILGEGGMDTVSWGQRGTMPATVRQPTWRVNCGALGNSHYVPNGF